ncbi:MAG TPA: ABC transporter permease, partial [Acidobacteriota bacterium]|nr:ABC transporter permease [Acidobacteriota bacterium]
IFVLVMFLPALINILIVIQFSSPKPPLPPLLIGLAGALLLAGAMLAVGLFISSLTENQIVAAALTFGVFIILWVLDASADPSSTLGNEIIRYLSVLNHYEDFTRGIFDTQHLVFYLSFIFLGLFLTSLSLDSVKWRK